MQNQVVILKNVRNLLFENEVTSSSVLIYKDSPRGTFLLPSSSFTKNPWKDWMSGKTDYYTSLITATARLPYPFGVCNLSILLHTLEETLFCNILTSDFVDFLLQVKFSFEILPWLIKVNHWKTSLAKTDIRKPSTFPLSKLPIMGAFEPLFFYWLQKEG